MLLLRLYKKHMGSGIDTTDMRFSLKHLLLGDLISLVYYMLNENDTVECTPLPKAQNVNQA